MEKKYKSIQKQEWHVCKTDYQKLNFIHLHEKILTKSCKENRLEENPQNEFILFLLGKIFNTKLKSISIYLCLLDEFIYKCVILYPESSQKGKHSKNLQILSWYLYDHNGEFCIRNLGHSPKESFTDFFYHLPVLESIEDKNY
jgi:hypothetical protein